MDRRTQKRLEKRAEVIKALAHPARLLIIEALAEGERNVGELTDLVGRDMSTVSRHLAKLRGAGIVEDEKRGAEVVYTLLTPCVLQVFSCVEGVLGGKRTSVAVGRRSCRV